MEEQKIIMDAKMQNEGPIGKHYSHPKNICNNLNDTRYSERTEIRFSDSSYFKLISNS